MTRRQKQAAAKRKRTIVANEGLIVVRSVKRRVRLTVVMRQLRTVGHGDTAVTEVAGPDIVASAHLDEDAVGRLIRRLQAVRGGKTARKLNRVDQVATDDIGCSCGSCWICSGGSL